MILVYGNKYIENRERVKNRQINNKMMFNKIMAYLSEQEENLIKKNLKVPNDWYEDITWRIIEGK